MKVKQLFFDAPAVVNLMTEKTRKAFVRFGGFVRTVSKRSMRKHKPIIAVGDKWIIAGTNTEAKTSSPGSPPFSREGGLRNRIFFGLEKVRKSVVIGPTPYKANAAEVLEYGGRTQIYDHAIKQKRNISVAPRPFMAPAFDEGQKKLPEFYKINN